MFESLFGKVVGVQLSCEYCKILRTAFFHKTTLIAASEKSVNFPGKHRWQMCNRFIFLTNATEDSVLISY